MPTRLSLTSPRHLGRLTVRTLLASSVAVLPHLAHAQDETLETDITLDPIMVTASTLTTTLQDAPASVTVIGAEDIEAKGARELTEVLREVPGLNLSRSNDGTNKVSFRGLSSSRTLILVDGKRINASKSFARHYQGDLGDIPTDAIERIEVVRGPMSTVYGSDAMGGVINIITKKPTKTLSGSVSADFGFGDHSTTGDNRQITGYVSGAITDTLSFSAWSKISEQDAPDPFTYTDSDGEAATAYGSDGSKVRNFGTRLSWTPSDTMEWGLEYSGSTDKYLASEGAHDTNHVKKDSIGLTNEWTLGQGTLSSYLRYEHASNESWDSDALAWEDPIEYDTTSFETRYTSFTQLGSVGLEYTLGGTVMREELNDPQTTSGTVLDGSATTAALYGEGRLTLTDRLSVTGGARLDHHEEFGEHLSPRLYANYDLGHGMMLKAGYSEAFVAPDLRSLDPNYKMSSRGNGCKPYAGPCVIYGNEDLEPETSQNYEIGINAQGRTVSWELTAFYNDVDNMIGARQTGETDPDTGYTIYERTNLDSGKTAGIEGGLTWQVQDGLKWTNTFTYLAKSEYTYTYDALKDVTFPMATTPKWNITTGLDWTVNDRLNLSGTLTYVGKQANYQDADDLSSEEARAVPSGQNSDPYYLVDVAMNYRLNDQTNLRLGVDNLFDQQPSDETSYRENGRLYKIGLTTRF
ncbi:TonB-dependent receptor plug domain-containing protein [Thioclava kandeliae]|uniref:TonB-dependent receptor n=1 Tax=Thioclava kandeliae TaxID=3070818 RepID=A0ABV1SL69_9RHOB